ncbi:MAG: biotin transporter BioY [Veillonella sp.]|nr:biotin transporter BioY [Veillonella sp.]
MSSTVSKQTRITTRQLTMTALFVALIAVGAFIRVPLPNCPFTLQILFTTLAGIVLGSRLGAASVGIYIVLGLVGVPIFTSGGGPSYILQPTFGYLIGFMVGAYAVGRIAETMDTLSFKRLLAGSILNLFIVYGLGMVYLYFIMNLYLGKPYLGKPIGVEAVIITCFLIPVGPDIFLCAVAASLGKRIIKELQH